MHILIIEDEPLIRRSLKKLIEKRGVSVETESLGKAALEKIAKIKFDRIICDLMLTDITGFDIIEGSKAFMTPAEIEERFIIITAYSSQQVLERAKKYNCRFLQKPFPNINEAIDKMLEEL